ncbi:MAG: 6-carboxytetrahydropterin synthase [Bacteroidetes bacterium]|jgi:6-pyruvoyltetrahydropterin/6-carboxytetrahydropterin synthase|nr:6-carboxytetrahydropterin synthase [Bacteroidota bacterium]MBK8369554.1 6-carboxytetrahydropterin synthase [Bacteroidota bacterium]
MRTAVFRKANFNSAHRLNNPLFDEKTNEEVFGLCNNPNYHGHNYDLIVKIVGEVDEQTGYVFDLKILNDIIKDEIIERFDHRNLNLDTVEFKTLNPTAENIARVIYELLRVKIDIKYDLEITLYETPRNYVVYPVK